MIIFFFFRATRQKRVHCTNYAKNFFLFSLSRHGCTYVRHEKCFCFFCSPENLTVLSYKVYNPILSYCIQWIIATYKLFFSCCHPPPPPPLAGHFTGKFTKHRTLWGCPLYHNMTAEECQAKADARAEKRLNRHQEQENDEKKALRQTVSYQLRESRVYTCRRKQRRFLFNV